MKMRLVQVWKKGRINLRNKSAAIDHFYGCMQWYITKFFSEDIKDEHNVIQKGILPNSKKSYKNCARKVWGVIV